MSIFPVAPLIVVAVSSLTGRFSTKVGATVLALASIAILPSVFVAATNAEDTEPEATLFVYDIIGIAVQTPDPPGFIRERIGVSFTAEQLQDCYNSKSVRPFLWHGKCTFDDRLWPKKEMWLRTIRQYPWEYLKHRFSHHGELFGRIDVQMDGWVDRPMFAEHNSPKSIGDLVFPPEINFSISGDGDNPILNAVLRHQRFISSIGFGSPYVWTAMAFAATLAWKSGRSFRDRQFLVVTAISLSSVANTILSCFSVRLPIRDTFAGLLSARRWL